MMNYWLRYRFPYAVIFIIAVELAMGLVFVQPYIDWQANEYNSRSIYSNAKLDFIIPDPSLNQIKELEGFHGIDKVFPYYATDANVNVNHTARSTMVLLSDQFENVNITMYNESRLIEKSKTLYTNPILVDWQFCRDTSAKIGDIVNVPLGATTKQFTVFAIYETNEIYENGAILAQISHEESDSIMKNASNTGYSGAYITASNYAECRTYLTEDYRPLGRLKNRERFDSDDAYNIHYHAIMDTGYANEVTDLSAREKGLNSKNENALLWIGVVITFILFLIFNLAMSRRGCERNYFIKHNIPLGINVTPYYIYSLVSEVVLVAVIFAVSLLIIIHTTNQFIPSGIVDMRLSVIPIFAIIAEILGIVFCILYMNRRVASIKVVQQKSLSSEFLENQINKEVEQSDLDDAMNEQGNLPESEMNKSFEKEKIERDDSENALSEK